MNIDPLSFIVARVRAIPGLPVGTVVSSDLAFHEPGTSAIDIALEPGPGRMVRDRMDAFSYTLNHYGPDKGSALRLAMLVRRYLLEVMPGTGLNGVAVHEVEENQTPWEFDDKDSHEKRFVHRVTISVYEY